MPKVCFLIPASPNAAFFSQIAAFRLAMKRLDWQRWTPSLRVFFGGEMDLTALARWRGAIGDIDMVFLSDERFERDGYFAQGDARFYMAPDDADVIMLSDADTLLVGSVENMLDQVLAEGAVAGAIAHLPFPKPADISSHEAWLGVARGLITKPLKFDHTYALMHLAKPDTQLAETACPFYVNFGAVAIAAAVRNPLSDLYLRLRREVVPKLSNPYFSAQVAFTLAVTELGIPTIDLGLSYNYPNDMRADRWYQEALADVRIIHYLRTDKFDRWNIFASAEEYARFLSLDLSGSNAVFQDRVRTLLGEAFPFELLPV